MTDAPFATAQDVADRWRPLTSAEETLVWVLVEDASALLRARFPGIDSQASSGAVDYQILKMVVAGMVKRAMITPSDGVASQGETMGPFSQSRTFANPLGNVFLTAADLTLILGYQPTARSATFANTTSHCEGTGASYVYGW